MAKKALTVTQIKMYESMIEADFEEMMDTVNEYRSALNEQARVEVGKETGLFELKMQEKKLELQLSDIRDKITALAGKSKWEKNKGYEAMVERRVSQLLGSVGNGSLAEIQANYEFFLRKVRLAGVTDDVRDLFEKDLPAKIKELSKKIASLPAPKKIRSADEKLLLED
jgi:hypothetical protein